METDRRTKAEFHSAKLKEGDKIRRSASKSNGKHAEKKRNQTTTHTKTAKRQSPSIEKVTRRAQEELIGTRQRLLATYEHAPIGIAECSPEGKYVNCNEEFCRLTGYNKEEVLSLGIKDITYEEDYIFDIKLHQRLVAGEIPFYKLEKRIIRKDGRVIWVELTRNVVRDSDGRAFFTIGAVLDVTERKRAELEIRTLSKLPAENPNPVMRLTPDGDILFANNSGISLLEFWKRQTDQTLPDELRKHVAEVFASGLKKEIEIKHQGKTFSCTLAPIREAGYVNFYANDITERKQMEEALRQSEERFARFMQYLPGLAWIKDMQGHYIYANAAAEIAFNTPREKLYGKTDQDVFPAEVATQFKRNDEQALLDEKGVQVIETLEHADGVLHYSLVNKFPIPGPDGDTILIGGTAFDITERKQAEEALHESRERYRNLFDLVPVAVYACDADGLIQEYNHRAAELWGREPEKNNPNEKYCGSFRIYDPDGRFMPHAECPMARLLNGETLEPHELEILIERPDGERRNVVAHPLPLKNERGEIVAAINCLYDITERKQAEQALQELNLQLENRVRSRTAKLQATNLALREEIAERQQAEELLRRWAHIFEHADWGISTVHQDTLTMVNPTYAKMHGHTAEELVGRSIYEIYAPESHADLREQIRIAHEKGHHIYESKQVRKDGSIFPVLVDTTVIRDTAGNVLYRAVNVQDITERKRVEQQLHESRERLQILSRRLVEVQEDERRAIARELHDRVGQTLAALNINLIIMNGQLLDDSKQRIGSRLDDSLHLVADAISLVRNVMTDLRPAVLDDYGLEAALQSYIDEYKSRYGIRVLLDQPDTALPRLDPGLEMTLLRIGQEALTNVSRHSQAKQVSVSLRLADHLICLTVQDDGVGFESQQGATHPSSHGLKIMRERAQAFGGSVHIESAPGKGTKVEARIPVESGGQDKVWEESL